MGVIERTRGMGRKPGYWLGVGLWTCFLPLLCFFSFGYVFICPMWKVERANWLQVFSFILQKDSEEYFLRIKNFWSYQGKLLLVKKK